MRQRGSTDTRVHRREDSACRSTAAHTLSTPPPTPIPQRTARAYTLAVAVFCAHQCADKAHGSRVPHRAGPQPRGNRTVEHLQSTPLVVTTRVPLATASSNDGGRVFYEEPDVEPDVDDVEPFAIGGSGAPACVSITNGPTSAHLVRPFDLVGSD